MVKMACDLEECSFIFVAPTERFWFPTFITCSISATDFTTNDNRSFTIAGFILTSYWSMLWLVSDIHQSESSIILKPLLGHQCRLFLLVEGVSIDLSIKDREFLLDIFLDMTNYRWYKIREWKYLNTVHLLFWKCVWKYDQMILVSRLLDFRPFWPLPW